MEMLPVASETAAMEPMVPCLLSVRRVRRETRDTHTLELKPLDAEGLLPFAAGQFNMLYVFGVGEVPISISGDPTRPLPLIHTVRAVGPVSEALCSLRHGDVVGVRGPYGSHWPVEESDGSDLVIVAGGIGLAPLRPVVYHALARRERYGKIVLLYGARTPEDLLYKHQLEGWRSRSDLQVEVTVDTATPGWHGSVGVVTTTIARARFDPLHTVAMVCGPEVMMRFTIAELRQYGLSTKDIYVSMERNMKCAIGLCGHCQFGPHFVCKDGPVFRYSEIEQFFSLREV